jgi:predicted DNA-binding transcriptional regulator AlpA
MTTAELDRESLMDLSEVLAKMQKTWLYAEIKAGRFPAPIKLSPKAARWKAGWVFDYLAALGAPAQGATVSHP